MSYPFNPIGVCWSRVNYILKTLFITINIVIKEEVRNRNCLTQKCSLHGMWIIKSICEYVNLIPYFPLCFHYSQCPYVTNLFIQPKTHTRTYALNPCWSSGFAVKLSTNRRARLPPLWVDSGRIQFVRYYVLICAHWPEKGEGQMILWPVLAIFLIITPVPSVWTMIW